MTDTDRGTFTSDVFFTDDVVPGGRDHEGSNPFDDPERELSSSVALFEGDEGGLERDQRRALVAVLRNRFISARTHPREWRTLVAQSLPIRSRLNDLFLDLHLDTKHEVAYKRQVKSETGARFPTLVYDTLWPREETLLLVYLRAQLRQANAHGPMFVDRGDMIEFIAQHRPVHATDQAGDAKRADRAVDSLYKAGLLIGRSHGDRFEISNALEVLLPLERLTQLLTWVRTQNEHTTDTPNTSADAGTDDFAIGGAE